MRKLILIGFIVFGALAGLLSVSKEDWPTRVVMMAVGVLFALPIGVVLARIGKKEARPLDGDEDPLPGNGTSSKDLAANYWRDEGHPPFAKPGASEDEIRRWDRGISG